MNDEMDNGKTDSLKYMKIIMLDKDDEIIFEALKQKDAAYSFYLGNMYKIVNNFNPTIYKKYNISE